MSTVKSNAKYPQAIKYMVLYFVVVVLGPLYLFSLKRSTAVSFRVISRKKFDRRLCEVLELEHIKGEISFKPRPQNRILVPVRGVRFKMSVKNSHPFHMRVSPGLQDVWKVDKQLVGVQFGHRSQNLRYN